MNILLIAYYYPPLASAGAVRPRAMAEYLRKEGHRVTVLTHSFDKDQWSDQVIRIYDCTHNNNRRGVRRLQWLFFRGIVEMLNALGSGRTIHWFWMRRIKKKIKKIWQQVHPEIVLATYPPAETLETGLEFRHRYSVSLVADFRDGLLFEPVDPMQMQRFPAVLRRYRHLEQAVAKNAAAVIAAHPLLAAYWSRRHRTCQWIANGYVAEDLQHIEPADLDPDKIHLVHAGRFAQSDSGRDPDMLAAILEAALLQQGNLANRLQLHLLGKLTKNERKRFDCLRQQGLVRLYGPVSRARSLAFQAAADLLVLVLSAQRPGMIPGKFYEYLAAQKPLLLLNSSGTLADMVTRHRLGWVFAANQTDEAAAFLLDFLEQSFLVSGDEALRQQLQTTKEYKKLNKLFKQMLAKTGDKR